MTKKLSELSDAVDAARIAYFLARAAADDAWRVYAEALYAAIDDVEARGPRSLGDDPDTVDRLEEMHQAAVDAESEAQEAYRAYMEAWSALGQAVKEVVAHGYE